MFLCVHVNREISRVGFELPCWGVLLSLSDFCRLRKMLFARLFQKDTGNKANPWGRKGPQVGQQEAGSDCRTWWPG